MKIAILGLGTVGKGVLDVLVNNQKIITATMYQDVKTGNTVACFEDQPVMAYGVSQGNGLEIVAEEKDNFSTPYGFAVLKGQNADLLKMFNEGLKNIKANGTYDEIVAKYTSAK